jgi:hypothetical protein
MKKCVICKREIIEDKEKWVRLTDFNKGEEGTSIYYHLECWRERFRITNSERKKEMYGNMFDVLKKIGGVGNDLEIGGITTL